MSLVYTSGMNQPMSITIEILTKYSGDDAADIGRLLPHLSDKFTAALVDRQLLTDIISSPYHDQLVARDANGRIVGAATLTATYGPGAGKNAWLEDFVVDPSVRGAGIGSKLWDAAVDWCRAQGASKLGFTSNPSRVAAHAFYIKNGAVIRDTSYFKKDIN